MKAPGALCLSRNLEHNSSVDQVCSVLERISNDNNISITCYTNLCTTVIILSSLHDITNIDSCGSSRKNSNSPRLNPTELTICHRSFDLANARGHNRISGSLNNYAIPGAFHQLPN